MNLKERLLKKSTIADAATLASSRLFAQQDFITLPCKTMNLALSGDPFNGGLTPGIMQIAAESKHFKSKFALEIVKAFLHKFPEGVVLYYDSEFGTPESYFQGINTDNIIHIPVVNLEQFKTDIVTQLNEIQRGEKVMILVDSLGNIPSAKELADAESGKEVADMTRAKVMKSVFRMIMPIINQKDVYSVMVNHVYKTLELYSKTIVSGGTGGIYNSDIIWTITKAKEKDGDELAGYTFTINTYKSRFVKEESKFPITVRFDDGIDNWSGMLDLAIEAGYVKKISNQLYARSDKPEKTYKRKEIENNDVFMNSLFEDTDFDTWLAKEYKL